MTTISIYFNILALVLGVLIFAILLFRKGKSFAFKLLTVNIFIPTFFIAYSIILKAGWLHYVPHLFKVPVTLILLFGPLGYILIRALLNNEQSFKKSDWLHAIPFLLYFIELVPFFLHSTEYKLRIINTIVNQDIIQLIGYEVGVIPNKIHAIIIQLSNFGYVIATLYVYRKNKLSQNDTEDIETKNKLVFAQIIVAIKFLNTFIAMFAILFYNSLPGVGLFIMNMSLSTFVITLAVLMLVNPDYLYGDEYSLILSNNQKLIISKKALIKSNLLAMTNSTSEASVFLNTNCQVLYYNMLAEKRIKLIFNKQLMVDDDFKKYIQPGVFNQFFKNYENAIKGETISFEIQEISTNAESAEWFKITLMPIYNESKNILGISLKIVNIDKLKRLEIDNQEYIKKLEAIAWQEAHVLRAPIANLIGLARLLKKARISEDKTKRATFISQIYQEVERLNNHICEITINSNQILLENLKSSKSEANTADKI